MQKTCNRESYALSERGNMLSYLVKERIPIIRNPNMIIQLPERLFKMPSFESLKRLYSGAPNFILNKWPKDRYYSFLTPSTETISSYSAVVRDDQNDVLRISLVRMAIYECYLFALGLPASFPTEHIIVHGDDKSKLVPARTNGMRTQVSAHDFYDYELTVPADTEREEYSQRILNDLNEHFQLEVRVEKLSVVKESRQTITKNGIAVELIWQEQPTVIMKRKRILIAESISKRPAVEV